MINDFQKFLGLCALLAAFGISTAVAGITIDPEEPVMIDGLLNAGQQPHCATNPEFSPSQAYMLHTELDAASGYDDQVVNQIIQDGAEKGHLGLEIGRFKSSFHGRAGDWHSETLADGSTRQYFWYHNAVTQELRRVNVTADGLDTITNPTGYNPIADGPLDPGDKVRSIFAYTAPVSGEEYILYVASDSAAAPQATWAAVHIVHVQKNGWNIIDFDDQRIEYQAFNETCLNTEGCREAMGSLLPLDRNYVRWVYGSEGDLLFGSADPDPDNFGDAALQSQQFPGITKKSCHTCTNVVVTDDATDIIAPYAYGEVAPGDHFVGGDDTTDNLVIYKFDDVLGEYQFEKSLDTPWQGNTQLYTGPNGFAAPSAPDFEPYSTSDGSMTVFQLVAYGASLLAGGSELWMVDHANEEFHRITDQATTHPGVPQHKWEGEPMVRSNDEVWVYFNSYPASESSPVDGACQELWKVSYSYTPPDADGDGVADAADNCTNVANPGQVDTDGDGYGNACDGDFNNNCSVNFLDLSILKTNLYTTNELTDLNGDGVTNPADGGIFDSLMFSPPGPSGLPAICD